MDFIWHFVTYTHMWSFAIVKVYKFPNNMLCVFF